MVFRPRNIIFLFKFTLFSTPFQLLERSFLLYHKIRKIGGQTKMYVEFNCNPQKKTVGDCVIRAISKVLNQSWEKTYIELAIQGLLMCDMPSSNAVWGAYLRSKGFNRFIVPNECPDCYTVSDFTDEYRQGKFLLALQSHVVAVEDGNYYDTWDSGNEVPLYYWQKEG